MNQIYSYHQSYQDIYNKLISSFEDNRISLIRNIFEEYPNLNIDEIRDEKQYTLLHIASYGAYYQLVILLIEYYERREGNGIEKDNINHLHQYLEIQTQEGFTAMHLAAFKGELKIIKFLHSKGANLCPLSETGQTPLHTAAQGDQPSIIAYFLNKNININYPDKLGRTSLHWASFSDSELSGIFLISWGADVNAQDQQHGNTPLHLSVLSRSVRLTRRLLLRGSDRRIKNFLNKSPYDMSLELQNKIIIDIVEEKGCIRECISFDQTIQLASRSRFRLYLFVIMLYFSNLLTFIIILPYSESLVWGIILSISFGLSAIMQIIVAFLDPGYLRASTKPQDVHEILYKMKDPEDFCPDCQIEKPKRSRHCEFCKCCVMVYDHHCPWINNCIGAKNYFAFFIFLIIILIEMGAQLIFHITHIYSDSIHNFFNIHVMNQLSKQNQQIAHYVATITVIILCILFYIPLSILIIIQVKNILSGKTTNENMTKKKQKSQPQQAQLQLQLQQLPPHNQSNFNIQEDPQTPNSNQSSMLSTNTDDITNSFLMIKDEDEYITNSIFKNCCNMLWRNKNNPAYKLKRSSNQNQQQQQ